MAHCQVEGAQRDVTLLRLTGVNISSTIASWQETLEARGVVFCDYLAFMCALSDCLFSVFCLATC